MPHRGVSRRSRTISLLAGCAIVVMVAACGSTDTTAPTFAPDKIQFTAAQVRALDSSGQVIVAANPDNGSLKSLVDSTLLVLTSGIEARRLDVSTNLTTKAMYFVGIHRVVERATGSFSTWTVVGLDNPAQLTSLIEISGFAQSSTSAAPMTLTGTIGDGTGFVNGLLLDVRTGGLVTEWRPVAGNASFTSSAAGGACPGFTSGPKVTCALETMRVRFTESAPNGSGGASARQASIAAEVDVPTMRLTYTP
jgi:hypothetical protein